MWSQTYGYDAYGNRTSVTSPAYFPTYAPAPSINSTNNKVADTSFSYDPAGNLTQAPVAPGGAIQTYAYDAENKLVTFNGGAATYTYDGDGRRVKKVVGSTITIYVYDAADKLVAEYGNEALSGPGGTEYLTADHLGSTRVVTDGSGGVISRHDYLPFGEAISTGIGGRTGVMGYEQPDGINQKFTSKERDAESGLDYFGARFHSSLVGRFISVDPLLTTLRPQNPQTLNRYAYALNNPLRYIDRNGLYEEDVHRDLTTVLAMAAGFDEKTAAAIGDADQHVDEDPTTEPYASKEARRDYHFTTGDRRKELWNAFDASGSTGDLGVFLHAEQDAFSHAGYGPSVGHLSAAHAPDKTYNDSDKADNMARDTYSKLSTAAGRMGINSGNKVAWAKIDKLVSAFNRAKTTEEKKKIVAQIRNIIIKTDSQGKPTVKIPVPHT